MNGQPLTEAFEDEHHRIDTGIADFVDSVESGRPDAEALYVALEDLRRHIYLEEDHLFPPVRSGALTAALMVMVHEHGVIWRLMDAAEDAVAADPVAAAAHCRQLLTVLADHNMKEEPVVYPEADRTLLGPEAAELLDLLETETLPGGWICEALR